MKFIFTYFQTERLRVKNFTFFKTFLSTTILKYIALPARKAQLELAPLNLINAGISPILYYKLYIPNLHKALLIVPVSDKKF